MNTLLSPVSSASDDVLARYAKVWASDFSVVEGHYRLPDEVRAYSGCSTGRHLIVGLKSGELFAIEPDPKAPPKSLYSPEGRVVADGVYGLAGCPFCEGDSLLLGTGKGSVWDLCLEGAITEPHLAGRAPYHTVESKVRDLKRVGQSADRRILVATHRGGLHLLEGKIAAEIAGLPGRSRWIVPPPRGHNRDRGGTWSVISAEGHISTIDPFAKVPSSHVCQVGRLREIPLCVAADVVHDRLRSVIYGTPRGLRVAILDANGLRVDRLMLRTQGDTDSTSGEAGEAITHVRICRIFGLDHVLAAGRRGNVWARRWLHPEERGQGGWIRWPMLNGEILGLHIWPDPVDRDGLDFLQAAAMTRDHRVIFLKLYHHGRIRDLLRGPDRSCTQLLNAAKCEGASDHVRAAALTLPETAPDVELLRDMVGRGGPHTLDSAIARLGQGSGLTEDDVRELGVDIVLAAARISEREATRCASALRSATLAYLRDHMPLGSRTDHRGRQTSRVLLERWARLLEKYFEHGHTFGEKALSIDRHVQTAASRDGADAFIYEARRVTRGAEVIDEWEVSPNARVRALCESADGRRFWALQNDGVLRTYDLRVADMSWSEDVTVPPAHYSHDLNPSAQYARFLIRTEANPLVFPCGDPALRDVRLDGPSTTWSTSGNDHQVYSALDLGDRGVLLGLRDIHQPLGIYRGGRVTPLPRQHWGTDRHLGARVQAGLCRVYAMEKLPNHPGVVAVGTQDGHLRLLDLTREAEQSHERPGRLPVLCSLALGAPIRHLLSVEGTQSLIFAATVHDSRWSDLFCFEVVRTSAGPELRLRFREMLLARAESLVRWPRAGDEPQCVCVLDSEGRFVPYVAESAPRNGRTDGPLLGHRLPSRRILLLGRAAVPLGGDRFAVTGQRRDGHEVVRVIDLHRQSQASARIGDFLIAARRSLKSLVETRRDGLGAISPREVELLAALPLGTGAIRGHLVDIRMGSPIEEARLRDLTDQAWRTASEDVVELKALLTALRDRVVAAVGSEQTRLLSLVVKVFMNQPGRRLGTAERVRERTIAAQLLLSGRLLPLYAKLQPEEHEHFRRWVDDLLQDPEDQVCFETARALTGAFFEHLTGARKGELRLSPTPDVPLVATALWLIDAIARFLHARPPARLGPACDATTWAVVGVLVNLLRLYPDAALIIFDHLTIQRVEPTVFHILSDRLTRPHDATVAERLGLAVPVRWLDQDPTIEEILHHESKISGATTAEGEPDREYLVAFKSTYASIAQMAGARTETEIKTWAADCLKRHHNPVKPIPEWLQPYQPERGGFYNATGAWLAHVARQVHDHAHAQSLLDTLTRAAQRGNEHIWLGSGPLFEPEASIARVVRAHWCRILAPPTALRAGDQIGEYTLGPALGLSLHTHLAHQTDDRGKKFVVSAVAGRNDLAVSALVQAWTKLKSATEQRSAALPRIHAVKVPPVVSVPTLVMEWIDAKNLQERWGELVSGTPGERIDRARRMVVQIGGALQALHDAGLVHADVHARNILVDKSMMRYTLVDFDWMACDAGVQARPDSGTSLDAYRWIPKPHRDLKDMEMDVYALRALALNLCADGPADQPEGASTAWKKVGSYLGSDCPKVLWDWVERLKPAKASNMKAESLAQDAREACPHRAEVIAGLSRFFATGSPSPGAGKNELFDVNGLNQLLRDNDMAGAVRKRDSLDEARHPIARAIVLRLWDLPPRAARGQRFTDLTTLMRSAVPARVEAINALDTFLNECIRAAGDDE